MNLDTVQDYMLVDFESKYYTSFPNLIINHNKLILMALSSISRTQHREAIIAQPSNLSGLFLLKTNHHHPSDNSATKVWIDHLKLPSTSLIAFLGTE